MIAAYPQHVFLEANMECNLRCVQCDIYTLRNPAGELTIEERKQVIRDLAGWHPEIRLVLAGGEVFARRSVLFEVAAQARHAGVYLTISTNGTLIRPADIERLPSSGVRCVVVSLDSDEPGVHDRIRGVPGTFEKATTAIQTLVAARDRTSEDFTVLTSTILGRHNLARVDDMVRAFERLGVNTMLFQPIQPAFARPVTPNWWEREELFPVDPGEVDHALDALIALKRAGHRIFQSERQFEDMRFYLHQPWRIQSGQCASTNNNLMVDMLGNIRFCFNMERVGFTPVANVRHRSLREVWEDERFEDTRNALRACREGCGSMICHAR